MIDDVRDSPRSGAGSEQGSIRDQAVVAGALAVAVLNALPGVLGGWRWYRCEASRAFWVLLRVGQGSALTLAIAVGSLAVAGKYSSDRLFYLYALLPLAVGFVAEQLRVISAQTILDRRELADAQAVGELPEERAADGRRGDHAPRAGRDGALGARRGVPGAARGGHGPRVLNGPICVGRGRVCTHGC